MTFYIKILSIYLPQLDFRQELSSNINDIGYDILQNEYEHRERFNKITFALNHTLNNTSIVYGFHYGRLAIESRHNLVFIKTNNDNFEHEYLNSTQTIPAY